MTTSTLFARRLSAMSLAILGLAASSVQAALPTATQELSLSLLGRHSTGLYDKGGSEIPTYDAASKRVFTVNLDAKAIDVIDISNPASPVKVGSFSVTPYGASANSVSAHGGVVAAAVEAVVKTDPGKVVFFNAADLSYISEANVGALPDMLTWTRDGSKVLVANEGEPNDAYTIDPEGSVSIIDTTDLSAPTVRTATFSAWNTPKKRAALIASGVRIFGPNASVAQDLEPEYIAVNAAGTRAWVTLQENNAVATVDLASATVLSIRSLGTKDNSLANQGFDASDKDSAINIQNWPVKSFYLPDGIAAYTTGGKQYLVMANEGDTRGYAGYNEEIRVGSMTLDPSAYPTGADLKGLAQLGRFTATKAQGDANTDGAYEQIYGIGTRSFSIRDAATGQLVWDSGDWIEQIVANQYPDYFNASSTSNTKDDRSDNKGPEPEGVVVSMLFGKPYAFIGLERMGGVMVFNIEAPYAPKFVTYFNPRDFTQPTSSAAAGDLAPEGMVVIKASESPNHKPLLVVSNETSGTTAVIQIDLAP